MNGKILPSLGLLLLCAQASAFEVNGRSWPQMPIPYWVNPTGCPVLPSGKTFEEVAAEAAAQWCAPPCAAVSFEFLGTTSAGLANDGQNTFLCIAEDWNCGAGAAGCNVWIPKPDGEPPENDIAINADELIWVEGGPDATQGGAIDPVSVLTHEIGHMLGMAHSPDPFATMYYGSLPNGIQATISGDDRAGICSIYPSGAPGCTTDADCTEDERCRDIQGISICDELHDGPGAFCSKSVIDCDGMCWVSFYECTQVCLFTNLGYTAGYCAPLCESTACPDGFDCQYFAQPDVHVCVQDDPPVDGGDGGDNDGGGDGGDGEDAGIDAGDDGGSETEGESSSDADHDGADEAPGDPVTPTDDGGEKTGGGCGCAPGAGAPGALIGWCFGLVFLWAAGYRRRRILRTARIRNTPIPDPGPVDPQPQPAVPTSNSFAPRP